MLSTKVTKGKYPKMTAPMAEKPKNSRLTTTGGVSGSSKGLKKPVC